MSSSGPISTPYFSLQPVAEGVYAAIAVRGTGAMANAGIIDLGDQVVVFDSMYTPQAGQALHDAAVQLFGKPVTLLLNSHFHLDHTGGNQAFPGVPILSTAKTRSLTHERTTQFLTFAKAHPDYPLTVKQALERETDAKKRQEKAYELGELLAMDAALPILVPTLATLTFHDSITLHGSKRSAVLRSLGNGHSPCDSALFLPDDDILFAGDLLFAGAHPSIMTGNVPEWISILDALLQDCPALIVPGHGPVADKQAVPPFLMPKAAGHVSDGFSFCLAYTNSSIRSGWLVQICTSGCQDMTSRMCAGSSSVQAITLKPFSMAATASSLFRKG